MPKSFYIIDGHAQIYRAYYAPFRELTSPSGEPTKATFVFTQMLLNLLEQRKPDYLAMVIDSGKQDLFRTAIHPEYKANRTKAGDDFFVQEQRILQVVRDAGLPVFVKPGYEADDLIATMAKRLSREDFEVFIVSKDKDLRQIVDERTKMYDVQNDEVIDPAAMLAKCGFMPQQAIEIQTLMGDATDNVPGIPGIGEKTALKLINKYGSADKVLEHLDELTPKLRENFEKHAAQLPITRQLVTLKSDVDFEFDPETCRFTGLNLDVLREDLQSLGFHALVKRLTVNGAVATPATPLPAKARPKAFEEGLFGSLDATPAEAGPTVPLATADGCRYCLVDTQAKFADFLSELRQQKRFAFDTETDALGAMKSNLIGMSFSWASGTGYYVSVVGPLGSVHLSAEAVLPALRPILEDSSIQKIGHNIKYDLLVMRNAGVHLRGIALDTMVAAFLVDASRNTYGIDALARDLLSFQKIPTTDLIGKGKNQISMDRVPLERVAIYASEDADIAWRLAEYLQARLGELPELRKLCDDVETPLVDVLAEMEFNGVAIDPDILKEQSRVLGERIEALRARS